MLKQGLFFALVVLMFALLMMLSGCDSAPPKVSSVDELEETIHPTKKAAPPPDDGAKKKAAAAKAASGSGPVEAFDAGKATAVVSGVVSLEGAAPKVFPIPVASDAGCVHHREGMPTLMKEDVIVNDGKLANVVVYVSKGYQKYSFDSVSPAPARINQKGCQYSPHILAMMTDQLLEIQSSDEISHNIHISPKQNSEYNIAQPKPGIHDTKPKFTTQEIGIPVKCDVHGWMQAAICVFEHPFFTVTKEDGKYELKLPPGEYYISTWQESAKLKAPATQKVVVAADKPAELNFVYKGK